MHRFSRQRQSDDESSADYVPQIEATAATEHASRRREQRGLRIATAAQRKRPSMHRDGESSAGAVAKKMNRDGESGHKSKQRQRQRMHRDARAGQTTHRLDEATAATEQMHRAGESSAYYARIQLSNGSDRDASRRRAGQTMHQYVGARAPTVHASRCHRRREQRRLSSVRRSNGSDRACIATARAAQTMHRFCGVTAARDGESSTDCASLWRSYGNDRACIATARAAHNEDCLGF